MGVGKYKDLLKSGGFRFFLWAQFLGALNDNLYKMIVSLFAVSVALSAAGASKYLSLGQAVFILPFFLFSGYAGHMADVFSKRKVLICTAAFEIVAMSLALLAFFSQRVEAMLGVLFLMALQSTFFSPAKYGILPEMLPDRDLSRGNGLVSMTTFLGIILGTSVGGLMFSAWNQTLWVIGLILIAIAIAGLIASLGISRVPPSGSQQPFQLNPWAEVIQGVRRLYGDKRLWLTVMGISYFWFLGAVLQIAILLFGTELLAVDELGISILLTFLAVGIGMGSVIGGRLSGDKVELGLVPLGAVGMGGFALLLAFSGQSYNLAAGAMALLGLSAGFFIVPLEAFLQQRSGRQERGRILAAKSFLTNGAILLASLLSWVLRDVLDTPPDRIILICGIFTLLSTVYVLKVLPDFLIRFVLWLFTHTVYKVRIVGQEHVPFRGPALLVCNHLSSVDGLLVGACVQRFIRFMVYRPYYEMKAFHWIFRLMNAIPVQGGDRGKVAESLERARKELRQGHVVCIFAEGAVSRTGHLLPFKRGFERIVNGLDVPVIPVHLDGVWGSIFSFKDGRWLWKWPRRVPYPVTVSFGKPMPSAAKAHEVRRAVMELGTTAVEYRRHAGDLLHLRFLRTAKRRWFSFCMADSSGTELTYGQVLVGTLALSRLIRKQCLHESMVGLLFPSSLGGALANIAVMLAGKVPVNLNFTVGEEAMRSAVQQCGIKTIFTSLRFLKKARVPRMEGMVFVERVMKRITPFQKARTAIAAFLLPVALLRMIYSWEQRDPSSLATVIFSSGSTGAPKGVMLSHHNVLSNIESIAQIFWVTENDRMMGVLPFFHSFGFTVSLWFPIVSGFGAVYHANPLDAKTIGELVAKYEATILISTPAFYSAYLRKCSPEQFSSLRFPLAGAEKLQEPLARAFEKKFNLRLLEGYGTTEMAPVVSVNVPDVAWGRLRQTGSKAGTVGHPVPGVAAKVLDLDTDEVLPPNQEGMLLVKGPNRMMGYLGQPEKTKEALRDGWYVTGDVALLDDDGFIRITGRLSRFSKIGGEMVPHIKIEEVVTQLLAGKPCAVTALPDERRGERLVVFYADREVAPEELWNRLSQSKLPKLFIPKRENLYLIDTIPTLGTGKIDLRRLREMARERGR